MIAGAVRARVRARRGFTILELAIASILMLVVSLVLARAWSAFGRPALLAVARARIALEANLAAEAIARDVARLARAEPGPGGAAPPPSLLGTGAALEIRVDDGSGTVRTVTYETDPQSPGKLFRSVESGRRVVAVLVDRFEVTPATRRTAAGDRDAAGYDVALTLSHRVLDRDPDGSFRGDLTRRYLLFVEADAP